MTTRLERRVLSWVKLLPPDLQIITHSGAPSILDRSAQPALPLSAESCYKPECGDRPSRAQILAFLCGGHGLCPVAPRLLAQVQRRSVKLLSHTCFAESNQRPFKSLLLSRISIWQISPGKSCHWVPWSSSGKGLTSVILYILKLTNEEAQNLDILSFLLGFNTKQNHFGVGKPDNPGIVVEPQAISEILEYSRSENRT